MPNSEEMPVLKQIDQIEFNSLSVCDKWRFYRDASDRLARLEDMHDMDLIAAVVDQEQEITRLKERVRNFEREGVLMRGYQKTRHDRHLKCHSVDGHGMRGYCDCWENAQTAAETRFDSLIKDCENPNA